MFQTIMVPSRLLVNAGTFSVATNTKRRFTFLSFLLEMENTNDAFQMLELFHRSQPRMYII